MSKEKEFENILDECLERMLVNGETVEQCLQSFPQHAEELKPLLETAVAAGQASAIQPRPEFRDRARYQLLSALRDMEQKRSRSFFSWGWQPRWATAAVTIVLVLLLSSGGTVAAASGSMPDETLYPVKLATEQARLTFTFSELGKAELYAELADQRVDEIVYLAEENKPEQIEQTADRLNKHLLAMVTLSSPEEEAYETAIAPEVDEATGQDETPSLEVAVIAEEEEESGEAPAAVEAGEDWETPTEEEATSTEKVPASREELQAQEKTLAPDKITAAREAPGTRESTAAIEAPETREATAAEKAPVTVKQFATGAGANITVDRRAQLKVVVISKASTNTARLRAVLDTAPESSRPALTRAIDSLEVNYQKAIESLDKP